MKTRTFVHRTRLPVPAPEAFEWHVRPGALDRLIPPWEKVQVVERLGDISDGGEVKLITRIGPLPVEWLAKHTTFIPGREFRDVQVRGPFSHWEHTHRFEPGDNDTCSLEDRVEYALPGGQLGRWLGSRMVEEKLRRMFVYRHDTTDADLRLHHRFNAGEPLSVAITGSSGLIGSQLAALLTTGGHQVIRLHRDASRGRADSPQDPGLVAHLDASGTSAEHEPEVAAISSGHWNPDNGAINTAGRVPEAVVHLAGENLAGRRWSEAKKQRIRGSRVDATRRLCESLAAMPDRPRTLICASAIGYYGSRGDAWLDEGSPPGNGFLAEVCQGWEEATEPARRAGIRVVCIRLGMVISGRGGALPEMLTPFRFGAGGPVGSGQQYWSWIGLDDAISAIFTLIMNPEAEGPVNLVAPSPVTNREFTKTLARVLRRPAVIRVPKFAARTALGEMADEMLFASARVKPCRLLELGYTFRHSSLETVLRHELGWR